MYVIELNSVLSTTYLNISIKKSITKNKLAH